MYFRNRCKTCETILSKVKGERSSCYCRGYQGSVAVNKMMNTKQVQSFLGSCSALQGRSSAQRGRSRQSVTVRAERAGLWLPGIEAPKWLDGSLPADRGFDPLGLATDSERLEWFVAGERYNGQWAMAGAAGILGQVSAASPLTCCSPQIVRPGMSEPSPIRPLYSRALLV